MGNGIFDLSGKVVLVTGGGSGIGRAYCEGVAEFGADVACCDIIEERARETVELLNKFGHRAIAITADAASPEEVEYMVNKTNEQLGTIDVVFANAGINEGNRIMIHEKPIEDWDRVIAVDLRSVFLLMRVVFPQMMQKKAGSFITTASVGGMSPVTIPLNTAYSTAKAGVIQLTKVAARQYAEYGIRVNSICPGWHRTAMRARETGAETVDAMAAARVPLKRAAEPGELKGLAVWLASDASSFVTGQAFVQDGGEIA